MKNSTPLVSVTVVTYNDSKFIEQTLDSVKAQTYENLELIVSDDCSSDDTVEICRHWLINNKERFVRAEILTSAQNMGVTANITKAQRAANGVWIKGIGGDDLLVQDCIARFIEYSTMYPQAYLIQCRLIKINSFSEIIGYNVKKNVPFFWDAKITANLQHQLLLRIDPIEALGLFKNKKMLEDLNYYDMDFPMQEDTPFMMKATSNGYRFYLLDEFLVKRRMREGTLSGLSDNFLIGKNDLIRIAINDKYYKPYLSKIEKTLLDMNDAINRYIYSHNWLNRKTKVNRTIKRLLQSPYLILRIIKIKQIEFKIRQLYQ